MRILGVDPALSITGYGVIETNAQGVSLVEAGIIATSAKQILPDRLQRIHSAIEKLILDTSPEVMVLEKLYAHWRHPVTAFLLGQARGVIVLACAQQKVPLVEYSATRVKKITVGNGLAGKYQVQRMVACVLGIKTLPKYTDVTDALALALAHSHMGRFKIKP